MLTIRRPKLLLSCLLSCLVLLATPLQANEPSISFEFNPQSPIEELLINPETLSNIFDRLKRFSKQNFKLKRNIVFHFGDALDDETKESDKTEYRVTIRFTYLYQLYQIISTNYPQQEDVQTEIYRAAVEKLLWFELGRLFIQDYELSVSDELFALDNFSLLMLLNQYHQTTDYLLDATEVYLISDQAFPFHDSSAASDEASLDEERYRKAVCLILGKDYSTQLEHSNQPYIKLISELAWDQEKIELCKKLYEEKLSIWIDSLKPFLLEDNSIVKWLHSPAEEAKQATQADQPEA